MPLRGAAAACLVVLGVVELGTRQATRLDIPGGSVAWSGSGKSVAKTQQLSDFRVGLTSADWFAVLRSRAF